MAMKKIAIVSLTLPPYQSGQAVPLYHLLKKYSSDAYCLITQQNFYQYKKGGNSFRLAAKYYFLFPDYQIIRILTKLASIFRLPFLLQIVMRIKIFQIKKIVIREKCDGIMGCTGDIFDLIAALLVSRELNIPFINYTFDYSFRQGSDPVLRTFTEKFETDLVHEASHVIVPNECMKQEYLTRYNIHTTVIHNPFDLNEYEQNAADYPPNRSSDPVIVYTGAIYEAHYDAFQNLLTAIKKTGIPTLRLHLYTPQPFFRLRENGITGPVVIHGLVPNFQVPGIQRNGDILFLPLAFNSPFPEIIKTS